MNQRRHLIKLNQRAFTILELLIATAILSTILLLVTVMMINIGNLYYKGINQARIQDDVRSITNDVSQHLQLSDTPPLVAIPSSDGKTQAYCVGNNRYTYTLNTQIGSQGGQSPHVFWRDDNPTPGACPAPSNTFLSDPVGNGSNNGIELITPNSLLTYFTISAASPYTLSVGVAYSVNGDLSLLTLNGLNTVCHGGSGGQFCATAHLTTTVVQRLTGAGS